MFNAVLSMESPSDVAVKRVLDGSRASERVSGYFRRPTKIFVIALSATRDNFPCMARLPTLYRDMRAAGAAPPRLECLPSPARPASRGQGRHRASRGCDLDRAMPVWPPPCKRSRRRRSPSTMSRGSRCTAVRAWNRRLTLWRNHLLLRPQLPDALDRRGLDRVVP